MTTEQIRAEKGRAVLAEREAQSRLREADAAASTELMKLRGLGQEFESALLQARFDIDRLETLYNALNPTQLRRLLADANTARNELHAATEIVRELGIR